MYRRTVLFIARSPDSSNRRLRGQVTVAGAAVSWSPTPSPSGSWTLTHPASSHWGTRCDSSCEEQLLGHHETGGGYRVRTIWFDSIQKFSTKTTLHARALPKMLRQMFSIQAVCTFYSTISIYMYICTCIWKLSQLSKCYRRFADAGQLELV